jgi:phosphate transport system permease protein
MIKSYIIKIIEHCVGVNFLIFSLISSLVIILIFYSIFTNAFTFLKEIGISNFLFKTNWQPEGYLSDPKNSFGIIPLIINTLYITFFSLIVSFLFGMLAAIYLAEYTKSKQVRFLLKSSFEIVAGIPSIFYGFFGAFILAPALVKFGRSIGVYISMESILIPGIAIGVMMTPYVATLLDDAFSSIPKTLKDASTAMGVTKYETIKYLILPIALPEIISTLIIVISRVLGETMVVLLTCGIISLMTLNPLLPSTTITVQIVYLLTGDTSFDSVKTLSVFGLSLFLFVSTMLLNIISLKVKSKNKQL